ncbi:hypothetical protein [Cytobacillus oceanisediminis]|uniref:hypothetical protein n=1 Tax=Cytobacillus oceanisediminis TaxID=665099 RepID=UPI00203EAE91|nr:hypothetical protein [Cytobacillus oceanisediminis]MCM3405479.1 hypothetical protein [Cytobacillus oceanisediminis]
MSTKSFIEASRYAYKEHLIASLETENEVHISEKVEANVPYIFLRECFASFAKQLEGKEERNVGQAVATFTYSKANLDIVFSYLANEKLVLVFLESEMEDFPEE